MGLGICSHLVIVLSLSLYTHFSLARPAHDSLELRQENIGSGINLTTLVSDDASAPTGVLLKYHAFNLWK